MIDDMNLQEFQGAVLNEVTVGVGSLAFIFSKNVNVVVQCEFVLTGGGHVRVTTRCVGIVLLPTYFRHSSKGAIRKPASECL